MQNERTVKVSLVAYASDYISGMKKAESATKSTAQATEELGKKSKTSKEQMDKNTDSTKSTAKATEEASKSTRSLTERLNEAAPAGRAMLAVGAAMTAVGVAAAKTGIEYNTLQQQTRAALTTLLGSAEAANEQMDKLDDFARSSPFSKQVFITAQQQMLAFGIETKKVIPYLDAVQNAVAAAGGSNQQVAEIANIMSKISASSRITARELNEFGYRGVNAAELIGSQMGKTGAQIREEITAGSLDANVALDALAAGMSEKFDGASENVKNTMIGATDRVKAAFRDISADAMRFFVDPNGGGALVGFNNLLADTMRGFQKLPEPIKAGAVAVGGLTAATLLLGGAFITLTPRILAIKTATAALGLSWGAVGSAIKTATLAVIGFPKTIATAAASSIASMGGIAAAVARVGAAFKAASLAMLATPLGLLITGTAVAVGALIALNNAFKEPEASAEALAKTVREAATAHEMFAVSSKGLGQFGRDVTSQFSDLNAVLDQQAERWRNWGKGFIGDGGHGDAAKKALRKIGEELASLAQENLPQATLQFNKLAAGTNGSDEKLWELVSTMPKFRDELETQATQLGFNLSKLSELERKHVLLAIATGDTSKLSAEHAEKLKEVEEAAEDARTNISALTDELKNFGKTTLDAAAAEISYKAAVDAASKALSTNGATLDVNTEAGRANKTALINLNKSVRDHAAAVLEETGDVDAANRALAEGRQALYDAALAAGADEQAISELVRTLQQLPTEVSTDLKVKGVDVAERSLEMLTRPRTAVIQATFTGSQDRNQVAGYATGGAVRGAGTAKSDSIPALLSNGEHVLTARDVYAMGGHGEVYKFRKSLYQNAPKFADGGAVGFTPGVPANRVFSQSTVNNNNFYIEISAPTDDPTLLANQVANGIVAKMS